MNRFFISQNRVKGFASRGSSRVAPPPLYADQDVLTGTNLPNACSDAATPLHCAATASRSRAPEPEKSVFSVFCVLSSFVIRLPRAPTSFSPEVFT